MRPSPSFGEGSAVLAAMSRPSPAASPAPAVERDSIRGRSWADVADEADAAEAERLEVEHFCSTPALPTLADFMSVARRSPARRRDSGGDRRTASGGLARTVGKKSLTGPCSPAAGGFPLGLAGAGLGSLPRSELRSGPADPPAPAPAAGGAAAQPSGVRPFSLGRRGSPPST